MNLIKFLVFLLICNQVVSLCEESSSCEECLNTPRCVFYILDRGSFCAVRARREWFIVKKIGHAMQCPAVKPFSVITRTALTVLPVQKERAAKGITSTISQDLEIISTVAQDYEIQPWTTAMLHSDPDIKQTTTTEKMTTTTEKISTTATAASVLQSKAIKQELPKISPITEIKSLVAKVIHTPTVHNHSIELYEQKNNAHSCDLTELLGNNSIPSHCLLPSKRGNLVKSHADMVGSVA